MALHTTLRDGENYNINDKDLYNEKIFSDIIFIICNFFTIFEHDI